MRIIGTVIHHTKITTSLSTLLFVGFSLFAGPPAQRPAREEKDYFKKWLNEDVVYIITPEEKAVFQKLTTVEEKEHFIEQFWSRRDPDPRTAENEFKEEHYRRIAYANEHFKHGFDGWRTDRGRIYIIIGPPDELEKHPAGGPYERPFYEGGGRTTTYAFEVWRYRRIRGIGDNVELEFVDPAMSGEYRLALTPDEKDALLMVGNTGETLGEELGKQTRLDRIRNRFASNWENALFDFRRSQDMPFARFRQLADLQRPQEIQFKDLKSIVAATVSYHQLNFNSGTHWLRISEGMAIVPVTVEIPNAQLSYRETEGGYRATVQIYGEVRSFGGRIVTEFEDTVTSAYDAQSYAFHEREKSAYQKILLLQPGLYKLTLVCKDVHGNKLGTADHRLEIPKKIGETSEMMFSSVIPSRQLRIMDRIPERLEQFILGDVKIIPKLDRRFYVGDTLYVYFHLYNVSIDVATQQPRLAIRYLLSREGRKVLEVSNSGVADMLQYSKERVIVARPFALKNAPPALYLLEIEATDLASHKISRTTLEFTVLARPDTALAEKKASQDSLPK